MAVPKTIEQVRDELRIKLGWLAREPHPAELASLETTIRDDAQSISLKPVKFPTKTLELEKTLVSESLPQPAQEFLEAYDLYTPMLIGKADSEEEEAEAPLIADHYQKPFNIFEEFVETELNIMLSRYIDLCRCAQCRADIVALSLQQLPPFYVTGTRGTESARRIIGSKYMQRIMNAVTKSIHKVFKKPRQSCNRIKQVLWVRPDLEEAVQVDLAPTAKPASQAFKQAEEAEEKASQYDVELSFSSEVEELINLMETEQEPDEQSRYQDQFVPPTPQPETTEPESV